MCVCNRVSLHAQVYLHKFILNIGFLFSHTRLQDTKHISKYLHTQEDSHMDTSQDEQYIHIFNFFFLKNVYLLHHL